MAVEALAREALRLALGGAAAPTLSAALLVALEGVVAGWRRGVERVVELASAATALAVHMLVVAAALWLSYERGWGWLSAAAVCAAAALPPLLAPQRMVRLAGAVVAGRLADAATTLAALELLSPYVYEGNWVVWLLLTREPMALHALNLSAGAGYGLLAAALLTWGAGQPVRARRAATALALACRAAGTLLALLWWIPALNNLVVMGRVALQLALRSTSP